MKAFIKTLSAHQVGALLHTAGLPEVIKYGLIKDAELFDWLEWASEGVRHREEDTVAEAVERSCAIKRDIVQEDEREGGVRATLNLGHTFGHAIETYMNYKGWRGEYDADVSSSWRADELSICAYYIWYTHVWVLLSKTMHV